MNINHDGAEIDSADQLTVYGEWIKFIDGEGSTVKMPPSVVKKLLVFALNHINEFEEGAWNDFDVCDPEHIAAIRRRTYDAR